MPSIRDLLNNDDGSPPQPFYMRPQVWATARAARTPHPPVEAAGEGAEDAADRDLRQRREIVELREGNEQLWAHVSYLDAHRQVIENRVDNLTYYVQGLQRDREFMEERLRAVEEQGERDRDEYVFVAEGVAQWEQPQQQQQQQQQLPQQQYQLQRLPQLDQQQQRPIPPPPGFEPNRHNPEEHYPIIVPSNKYASGNPPDGSDLLLNQPAKLPPMQLEGEKKETRRTKVAIEDLLS